MKKIIFIVILLASPVGCEGQSVERERINKRHAAFRELSNEVAARADSVLALQEEQFNILSRALQRGDLPTKRDYSIYTITGKLVGGYNYSQSPPLTIADTVIDTSFIAYQWFSVPYARIDRILKDTARPVCFDTTFVFDTIITVRTLGYLTAEQWALLTTLLAREIGGDTLDYYRPPLYIRKANGKTYKIGGPNDST